MRLEEIAEGVEAGCHGVEDEVCGFVEEKSGLLVVCEVMRKAEHSSTSVAAHSGKVIYQFMHNFLSRPREGVIVIEYHHTIFKLIEIWEIVH